MYSAGENLEMNLIVAGNNEAAPKLGASKVVAGPDRGAPNTQSQVADVASSTQLQSILQRVGK